MSYLIRDWTGREIKQKSKSDLWIDLRFDSFEDAWDYLYEMYSHLSDEEFEEQMGEYEVEEVPNS